ncbi:Serine/threonine-protein kinase RIO1 [Mycena indigotica]|uniref:Serine/threonine-protein kinase RIO1 n=1 Tax=Mycena indigotica TaxID=2126181 RepID=A0A8H6SJF7_9AGAR|nr:Serine/threonine-protein kinase RIO1 [Mycena indigotica]KAF7298960.1 Serine/threonine-protein kinase RIO1 [Mycena indigotica]
MTTIIDSPASDWSPPHSSEEASDWDSQDSYSDNRVEDEDWERAEGDFTKQFNRLRQHVAVRAGTALGSSSALNKNTSVAPVPAINHPAVNAKTTASRERTTDQLAALAKFSSKISKIDVPYSVGVGVNRKGPSAHANMKDKADRATTEQVLDPRTRVILLKMVGRGLIDEVNGCVSTGKEANVYHALTPTQSHLALKIYKTSILVFKDRDKYVSGEHRFRRGYSRHNPRKMVRVWAEKEMRNLKRLRAAGLRAPEPLEVRENVLVMSFLGDQEGWASPRLKDAVIPEEQTAMLYEEMLITVRTLFHRCRLVHADLSEYNVLFHDHHLYIIDVSQSVEHDHPSAFDFLRNDLKNVEDFFSRRGVKCLGLRRSFEFVTREVLPELDGTESLDDVQELVADLGDSDLPPVKSNASDARHATFILRRWLSESPPQLDESLTPDQDASQEDAVFFRSHITRSLNEVFDPERDAAAVARGENRGLVYADALGLVPRDDLKASNVEVIEEADTEFDDDDDDDESEGAAEDTGDGFEARRPRGHRHEDRDEKKERKKAVKAEAKERRKHKMPKAEKKRAMKKGK